MTRAPAAALAVVLLSAGCGGAARTGAAPASPAPSGPTASPIAAVSAPADCPPSGAPTARWPAQVPADLPVPPTAKLGRTEKNPDGLTLIRFSTTQSVRQGVVFLAGALQPAGYALGRGDAEANEADVPFSRGTVRGLMKMVAQAPCATQWILALQTPGARGPAPTAAAPMPSAAVASPSPLPFG